jgi:hypothetical protein
MTYGVDYAWGRPGGAALQAAGVQFAARYLSHDETKAVDRAEADDLAAHGIWLAVVFEDTEQRPLSGRAAGVADAQMASAQAIAAGMPDGRPIYFAADFDVTPDQQVAVNEYLAGACSVLGAGRVGVYGGFWTVSRALDAGVAAWGWQTVGWSGGQWDPRAVLRQPGGTVTIGGVDCDTDTAMATDYGQWMPGRVPTPPPPPPAPAPAPQPATPPTTLRGDEMAFLRLPFGYACDVNGTLTDKTKALVTPVPQLGGPRITYRNVDAWLGCDFGNVRVRIAIHNVTTGWAANRIWKADITSEGPRYPIWLQAGDDKISIARMPASPGDTDGADVPASLLIEPVLA